MLRLLFSTEGRISRSQWWIGILVLVTFVLVALGAAFYWLRDDLILTQRGRTIILAISLLTLWPTYCVYAKRLHDRDRSGLVAILFFGLVLIKSFLDLTGATGNPLAPNNIDLGFQIVLGIFGLFLLVDLGLLRGTPGPNRYGPDPLRTLRPA